MLILLTLPPHQVMTKILFNVSHVQDIHSQFFIPKQKSFLPGGVYSRCSVHHMATISISISGGVHSRCSGCRLWAVQFTDSGAGFGKEISISVTSIYINMCHVNINIIMGHININMTQATELSKRLQRLKDSSGERYQTSLSLKQILNN